MYARAHVCSFSDAVSLMAERALIPQADHLENVISFRIRDETEKGDLELHCL